MVIKFKKIKKYANGALLEEIIVNKEATDINNWKKVSGGNMVNVITDETRSHEPPKSKFNNLKSVAKSLSIARKKVFNNFLDRPDNVYSIDFTYSHPQRCYDIFAKDLKKLVKDIRKINPDVLIIIFKEIQQNGSYHGHMFLTNIEITESKFRELWNKGEQISFTIMKSNIDIVKKTYYLTSILENNETCKRKREAYKYFPPYKKLIYATKNISKVDDENEETIAFIDTDKYEVVLETPKEKAEKRGIGYKTYLRIRK